MAAAGSDGAPSRQRGRTRDASTFLTTDSAFRDAEWRLINLPGSRKLEPESMNSKNKISVSGKIIGLKCIAVLEVRAVDQPTANGLVWQPANGTTPLTIISEVALEVSRFPPFPYLHSLLKLEIPLHLHLIICILSTLCTTAHLPCYTYDYYEHFRYDG